MRMLRSHPLAPPSGVLPVSRIVLYDKIGPGPHPCHWCGRSISWRLGISAGGLIADHLDWNIDNNDPENLVPSCNNCNVRRAAPGRQGAIQPGELACPTTGGYRTRAVERTCETCDKVFLAPKSKPRLYCSRSCYYASQVGRRRNQPKGQS